MFLVSSKYPILEGDTMLIEQTLEPPKEPTDPTIPPKFFAVKDAAQTVTHFAFEGDGVRVLKTFRAARAGGFTMAAICERACRYATRAHNYTPEERKKAIRFICERATRLARLYGELRRNRRYEWR